MTRLDLPRAIVNRLPPGVPVPAGDDPVVRLVERAMLAVDPDPLFRRRLRSDVVNRYVAAREGSLPPPRPRRQMTVIGRSVLYASLAIALGVSAVGAAAQESLPGDALYGVKLRLEEIRLRIAPASVRDELAEMMLAERVEELERLAAVGAWELVPAAAARVAAAEAAILDDETPTTPDESAAASQAHDVLESVYSRAPEAARDGLERALEASSGMNPPAKAGSGTQGSDPVDGPSRGQGPAPQASERPQPSREAKASTGEDADAEAEGDAD